MNRDYAGTSSSAYEHRLIAERAIGKSLPKGAEVHHVNGDKKDNSRGNLVICQNRAEHMAIHYRQRALDAAGNADYVRCVYCNEWGPEDTMYVRRRPRAGIEARHRSCHAEAERKRKANKARG